MRIEWALQAGARALDSLLPAVERLVPASEIETEAARAASARGYFRPDEEAALRRWFARLLTVRGALWEVVDDASSGLGLEVEGLENDDEWRLFVVGYAAACAIVTLDRYLLETLANDAVVQRKLNEAVPEHRVPRKQLTEIFESFSDPAKALAMLRAMRFANRHRARIADLAYDLLVGAIVGTLPTLEQALDPSKRRYFRLLARYHGHALRRRGASTRQRTTAAVLSASGRTVAELRDRWTPKRVDDAVREQITALLRPGDVLITRRARAFSNLFLPGYWPHAALYIGGQTDREALGVTVDSERARCWVEPRRVLEALKDGVRFRSLTETLAVDAVAVIRPRLSSAEIAEALGRAIVHEGKGYNFDFDFFHSERLVCTEVVYRAYDGVGRMRLPLSERAGRPTLSAEDLLAMAIQGELFETVAVFGTPGRMERLLTGEASAAALRESLSHPAGSTAE